MKLSILKVFLVFMFLTFSSLTAEEAAATEEKAPEKKAEQAKDEEKKEEKQPEKKEETEETQNSQEQTQPQEQTAIEYQRHLPPEEEKRLLEEAAKKAEEEGQQGQEKTEETQGAQEPVQNPEPAVVEESNPAQTEETVKEPVQKTEPPAVEQPKTEVTPEPVKPVEQPKPEAKEPVKDQELAKKEDDKKEGDKKEEEPKEKEKKKTFLKGEIANIGSKEIISPYSSAGVGIGMSMMDERYYLTINPKLSLRFNKIGLIFGIHVPLNIQLFNTDVTSDQEAFTFRTEDWDEWQDYLKILRYIQVGRSEDKFFFSMGSNFAQTIGHGTILKRYVPNHDATFSTLSTKLNWYCDYVGFEALLGDVARGNMFGGLVFVKPFSALGGYHAKSVSFGYTFVADRNAPTLMQYETYYGMPDPNTDPAAWDLINETTYGGERVRRLDAGSKNRPIILDTEFLHVQGIDFEFKAYKNEKVDLKFFLDYSWFKNDFENGGFTGGFLGRFNLDQNKRHAMRLQLEFRGHSDTYLPSFFDTYYDVERIEMMTNIFGKKDFMPDGRSKYWHLMNDGSGDWVFSFYGEFNYSWKTWMALSLGYEQLDDSFSIFGHFELPDLWILKGMISYYRRGIGSASDIFTTDNVSTVFRGVLRLQVLPILYINAYVGKHWAFWSADRPRPNDNLEGHFVSSWDWGFDLEFGYEWGKEDKKKKKDKDKDVLDEK